MGTDNSNSKSKEKVLKKDFIDNKDRWDLLPMDEVKEIVELLTIGSNNYYDNSWKDLEGGVDRFYAALLRHLHAWRSGEILDNVVNGTGKRHIAQVAVNALFLMYLTKDEKPKEEVIERRPTSKLEIIVNRISNHVITLEERVRLRKLSLEGTIGGEYRNQIKNDIVSAEQMIDDYKDYLEVMKRKLQKSKEND